MKNLIDWLMNIEEMAGNLYTEASRLFKSDKALSKTLLTLAQDEKFHFNTLRNAQRFWEKENIKIQSDFIIDENIKKRIKSSFSDCMSLVRNKKLTQKDIVACIIETELSEWNDFFLYIINTFKSFNKHFQYVASKIENHKKQIETLLLNIRDNDEYLERIKTIPTVWEKNILIIDDSEPIVELLVSILKSEYNVDTANNGKEGLAKINAKYYNLIISDIQMPELNGIEMYKSALKSDSNLNARFMFFSSLANKMNYDFISRNKLLFIQKPAGLDYIRSAIREKMTNQL